MCTVSVKVNEALLRGMRPELNSTAAIRQWAQQQMVKESLTRAFDELHSGKVHHNARDLFKK